MNDTNKIEQIYYENENFILMLGDSIHIMNGTEIKSKSIKAKKSPIIGCMSGVGGF